MALVGTTIAASALIVESRVLEMKSFDCPKLNSNNCLFGLAFALSLCADIKTGTRMNSSSSAEREDFIPYIIRGEDLRLIRVVAVESGDSVAKIYINFTTMRITAVITLLLLGIHVQAQDLLGYGHSNYAGIAGASYNPASLADSRFSMDIMLFGAGIEVANNYVGVKRSELRNPAFGPNNLYLRTRDSYARVLRVGAEHYLAAGIRPKILLGMGALYAFVNDAGYNFRNDSSLTIVRGDVNFGHSDNFTFDGGYGFSYHMGFNPGIGIDAGII